MFTGFLKKQDPNDSKNHFFKKKSLPKNFHKKNLGSYGEELALLFLTKQGFQLVEKNFRIRRAEIDLIVKKKHQLHFIEVKTKVGQRFGEAWQAVDFTKQRKISFAAQVYLQNQKESGLEPVFSVVSIELFPGYQSLSPHQVLKNNKSKVLFFENAFEFCL